MIKLLFWDFEQSKITIFQKMGVLIFLIILTLAFTPVTELIMSFCFNLQKLYEQIGAYSYSNVWDYFSLIIPLLLCLTSPKQSGLTLGKYQNDFKKIIFLVLIPIILSVIIYRYTSQPFKNSHVGIWLISPLAQDLLGGFMFGVLDNFFPSSVRIGKYSFKISLFFLALLASLWHLPNLLNLQFTFVAFQLFYTFVFAFIIYFTRIWSGSMLPILITHVSVNYIAWRGF